MSEKKIRRSQLIAPYGVGALVEIEGESFIVKDISKWPRTRLQAIELPGLKDVLPGVRELKGPKDKDAVVPVARFPRWLFCSRCRRMYRWTYQNEQEADGNKPYCRTEKCKRNTLVPMRWVRVCDAGHIDDIDWYFMAHGRAQTAETGQCDRFTAKMKFVTTGGRGGDFNSMRVACECGSFTSLDFIRKRILPGKCCGKQPWQSREDAVQCSLSMYAEPRGSSALHYPRTISALAIPQSTTDIEGLELLFQDLDGVMSMIKSVALTETELQPQMRTMLETQVRQKADDYDIPFDSAVSAVLHKMYADTSGGATYGPIDSENLQEKIMAAEYEVLRGDLPVSEKDFCTTHHLLDTTKDELAHYFRKITRVRRVREVRVIQGFHRRDISQDNEFVRSDLGRNCEWLNAANVIGEAIFLEFNESSVRSWEDEGDKLLTNWISAQVHSASESGLGQRLLLGMSPKFFMMHTFAHVLLRQLAYDCGYGSNALRERIYCPSEGPGGGILIYTADSDSEGSMGGLVELAEPARLGAIIRRAIEASRWCSSDPVCRESKQQGLDGLNRAACHACCLVAETSCAYMNVFLDRVLLTGGEGLIENSREPDGYFTPMVRGSS